METPRIVRVRQKFKRPVVSDISSAVHEEFARLRLKDKVAGRRVGITAGSRGIKDNLPILRALVSEVRGGGGEPLLLAAMGSHGGGAEDGQREILRSLGITEDSVGAPVMTCAKSVGIGETRDGLMAYALESALSVDSILAVNRIKEHTAFHGVVESGLFKMLVVGLGGPRGAAQFHSGGSGELPKLLLDIGAVMLEHLPIAAGFAIVENGYEETAEIMGIAPGEFRNKEPELLEYSRSLMPSLPVKNLHALIIEEMGKNYSGTGVDTNIIGRLRIEGTPEPSTPAIQKIVVLDISEESHGNANGIGLADATTRKLVEKIDRKSTYLNCATTGFLTRGATPVYMDTERETIDLVMKSLGKIKPEDVRLTQIPSTLHLTECMVSEALIPDIEALPDAEIIGEPKVMEFEENGALTYRIGRHA
ncbi:MAG: hypothetical protein LBT23_07785 [Synergistaceae bacterium]|jgi:hypothetical protein|nr:hypothetical protein [Synergistaceae bacterium]